jgi:hypothetical protein
MTDNAEEVELGSFSDDDDDNNAIVNNGNNNNASTNSRSSALARLQNARLRLVSQQPKINKRKADCFSDFVFFFTFRMKLESEIINK